MVVLRFTAFLLVQIFQFKIMSVISLFYAGLPEPIVSIHDPKYGTYIHPDPSDADSVNSRLTAALLKRHSVLVRPVAHPHEAVKVNVLCALYQIVDVDQRSNLATISAYFDLWWHDQYLKWNTSDYGGATQSYLPSHTVWTPDLYLYHSVQGSTPLAVQQSAVQVTYDGTVRVFIPFTARALCTINVKYFPYDTQQCEFVFGSWSYRLESVEYVVASGDVFLNDFYDNQEWILMNSTLHQTISLYMNSAFNETYSAVTLRVVLQRQSFYYVFNLVLPVTLVTVVSVIGFHIAANSSQRRESKFRLGIMTLLSMGVLLLNVVNDMPKFSMHSEPGKRGSFSDVPLLGLFYIALIVIISVGTTSTGVFVALEKHALHHPEHVPWWLDWLNFDWPSSNSVWNQENTNKKRKQMAKTRMDGHANYNSNLMSLPLTTRVASGDGDYVNDNDMGNTHNNCISKKNEGGAFQTTCCNSNSHTTTPKSSYRCAIHHQPTSPLRVMDSCECSDGLANACIDILNEIRMIREQLETCANVNSTHMKIQIDPHRHQSSLTKSWSRVIHRLETLSLIFYLGLVGVALIMFFIYGWY